MHLLYVRDTRPLRLRHSNRARANSSARRPQSDQSPDSHDDYDHKRGDHHVDHYRAAERQPGTARTGAPKCLVGPFPELFGRHLTMLAPGEDSTGSASDRRGWSVDDEPTNALVRYARMVMLAATIALAAASIAAARPQIAGLQVALQAHGLYRGRIDGIYGPATSRALRTFQRTAGLAVDGRVGPATRSALGKLGRPGFGTRLLRRRAAGWDVSVLQYLLSRSGAILTIDGHFGLRTEQALKKFQRAHKLDADGVAGRRTLRALLVPSVHHFTRTAAPTDAGGVRSLIDYWSAYYGVDKPLMHALAWMESGYQPNLTSSVGAWGVMQILPSTWSYVELVLVGRTVRRTVSGNIRVGVAFMRQLLREFNGDVKLALAAWYQGPASVRRLGPLPVTRIFVADVLALRQRFS